MTLLFSHFFAMLTTAIRQDFRVTVSFQLVRVMEKCYAIQNSILLTQNDGWDFKFKKYLCDSKEFK